MKRPWRFGDSLPCNGPVTKTETPQHVVNTAVDATSVPKSKRTCRQFEVAIQVASAPDLLGSALRTWDNSYNGVVVDQTLVGRIHRYHQILSAAGEPGIPVTKKSLDIFAACLHAAAYKTVDDAVRAVRSHYARIPGMVDICEADSRALACSVARLNRSGCLDHSPAEPVFLHDIVKKLPKPSKQRHAALTMFFCALRISELNYVNSKTLTIKDDIIVLDLKNVTCKSNKIRTVIVRCYCGDLLVSDLAKSVCLCHTARFLQEGKMAEIAGPVFSDFEMFCKRSFQNKTHGFRIGCLSHLLYLKNACQPAIQAHCRWASENMLSYYRRKVSKLERSEDFKNLDFLP